jgi:8-oxo-dGTP pyrophosphatase MutT (NUDIX family)
MSESSGTLRAAGVLLHRGGRWLLLKNSREGHWGFAKGHLEEGEHELAGALREVKEETGFLPRIDPVFREAIRYRVPATKKRPESEKEVVYFLGSVGEKEEARISSEHSAAEWLTVDECLKKIEHAQLRETLTRASRFLQRGR